MLFGSVSRQIISDLKIEPKLWGRIKGFREQPSRVRRNSPFPFYDFIDSLNGYSQVVGKLFLTQSHRLKIFLEQNGTWMGC